MAVQRSDRYATASGLAEALEELVGQIVEDPEEGPAQERGAARTPPWAWGALALAALSCLSTVALLATRSSGEGAERAQARSEAEEADLARARTETRRTAQAAEVRRVLQEVDLQQKEGAAGPILLRQLARALAVATGEEARAVEAKLAEVEAETLRLSEARKALEDLDRRNLRLAPVQELTAQLEAFAIDHPLTRLPPDLKKRHMLLKASVAGRGMLVEHVARLSTPPTEEELMSLLEKASQWTPFNPLLGKEANQFALKLVDALLLAGRDKPTPESAARLPIRLIFRGLIQHRLGDQEDAKKAWKLAVSGIREDERGDLVESFQRSGLLTLTEIGALEDAVGGRRRGHRGGWGRFGGFERQSDATRGLARGHARRGERGLGSALQQAQASQVQQEHRHVRWADS